MTTDPSARESLPVQETYDLAVLIGRFQPFHNGHAALLAGALALAPRVVLVLGSAHQARDAKDPFTWEERAAMIRATLDEAQRERVDFIPTRDCYDDRRWAAQVVAAVTAWAPQLRRVALVGYHKDASSAYLDRFPDWNLVSLGRQGEVDATSLRQIYFEAEDVAVACELLSTLVPPAVCAFLRGWARLAHYARLAEEHRAILESRKTWGTGPFVTVDAVVRAAGRVLLVERGRQPGIGLWALPGGFLEARERLLQAAVRELREETGLGVLDQELESALRGVTVFDHPDRSLRGRTITHAHFFDLRREHLPEVQGGDDAVVARWFDISQLPSMEQQLFEDHFHILDHFLGLR